MRSTIDSSRCVPALCSAAALGLLTLFALPTPIQFGVGTAQAAADRASGGDDGNDVFSKATNVPADNGYRTSITATLAASISDGLCRDVDYLEFTGLTPLCDYHFRISAQVPTDFRIGWFDLSANLIFSNTGSVSLVADINGRIIVAVTGAEDNDFDGLDDATLQPHGVCGIYSLSVDDQPDANGTAPTAEPVVVTNGARVTVNSNLSTSPCVAACNDVDFFRFSGMIPLCEYDARIEQLFSPDCRVGWFDLLGNLIFGLPDGFTFVADANGNATIAVTGVDDADFDGRDDATMLPHGTCGNYMLTIDSDMDGNSTFGSATTIAVGNPVIDCFTEELAAVTPHDSECHDVDFFVLTSLIPLFDYAFRIKSTSGAADFRLGWYDKNGQLILAINEGGLIVVADANGEIRIAVTDQSDGNFDGFNDATGLSHGLCRAYVIEARESVFGGASPLYEDLNGDGTVDSSDLGLLIAVFGSTDCIGDINGDGVVNTADLGQLIVRFGDTV